jgi:very-short-patch-repair endonuclease
MPLSRLGLARYLRRTMSGVEWNLWSCLRARQLDGYKFRRKALTGPYIVDFACLSARLVVDMGADMYDGRQPGDDGRLGWLAARDFRVLRFTDSDVAERIDQVLDSIRAELAGRPLYLWAAANPRAGPVSKSAVPLRGSFRGRRTLSHRSEGRGP